MNNKKPLVSVVVVNHNGKELLKNCFNSLANLDYPRNRLELSMVDNLSKDDSVGYVKRCFPQINVFKNTCNNYCKANNLGIKKSKGDYVAMLNNDTVVDKSWLRELVKVIGRDDKIGAVGSKILLSNGKIQSIGHEEFPYYYWGDKGFLEKDLQQYSEIRSIPSVSNCSALYRKEALYNAGLFDEDFGMYMEDVDISFRLKQKRWKIFYAPNSKVYHKLHGSNQNEEERRFYIEKNRLLFIAKYFPEKLKENTIGYGNVAHLNTFYFQRLLLDLFNKLLKHHGDDKGKRVFSGLYNTIKKTEAYRQHCLRIDSERKSLDSEEERKNYQEQQNLINQRNQELANLNNELQSREERLMLQKETLSTKTKQVQDLVEQLNNLNNELQSREEHLKSETQAVRERDTKLNDFTVRLEVQKEKIQHLDKEIQGRTQFTQGQEQRIQEQQNLINQRNQELANLNNELQSREEHLKSETQAVRERDTKLNDFTVRLEDRSRQIMNLENDIAGLDNTLKRKAEQSIRQDAAIAEMNSKISAIYNSHTYRFIVRPIIWPSVRFAKAIVKIFKWQPKEGSSKRKLTKEKQEVYIAQACSKNAQVAYGQQNEYSLKLTNKGFREEEVRAHVDIWPYKLRSHPDRHYAFFVTKVSIPPLGSTTIKILYDWETQMVFFSNGNRLEIIDSWRGNMEKEQLYIMEFLVATSENERLGKLEILQRVKF